MVGLCKDAQMRVKLNIGLLRWTLFITCNKRDFDIFVWLNLLCVFKLEVLHLLSPEALNSMVAHGVWPNFFRRWLGLDETNHCLSALRIELVVVARFNRTH